MANELDLLINAARDPRKPKAIATVIATWGSAPRPVPCRTDKQIEFVSHWTSWK